MGGMGQPGRYAGRDRSEVAMGAPPPGPDGKIATVITYLEMTRPPSGVAPVAPHGVTLERVARCTVAFYRFLYNTVGEEWLWYERRLLDDNELRDLLANPE